MGKLLGPGSPPLSSSICLSMLAGKGIGGWYISGNVVIVQLGAKSVSALHSFEEVGTGQLYFKNIRVR